MTLVKEALDAACARADGLIADYISRETVEQIVLAALSASSPAAIAPAGWKIVPETATAENGMKYKLIGEVQISLDHDLDLLGGTLTWPAVKRIYKQLLSAAPSAIAPGEWVAKVRDHLMRAASDILVGSNRNENLGVVSNRIERGMWHISEALALIPEQGEG